MLNSNQCNQKEFQKGDKGKQKPIGNFGAGPIDLFVVICSTLLKQSYLMFVPVCLQNLNKCICPCVLQTRKIKGTIDSLPNI